MKLLFDAEWLKAAIEREGDQEIGAGYELAAPPKLWRHKKRGAVYQEIGRAKLQASDTGGMSDNEPMVVYAGEDGQLWVRPADEFEDGRFEAVTHQQSGEQDK